MKKRTMSLVVALMLLALTAWGVGGCIGENITGSGNLVTEPYDLSDFSRIEAHSGFELEVTAADTFSIEITTDDNIKEYIAVEKSGDTLDIRLRGTRFYYSVTVRATITMPELYYIELTGGSKADITGFSSLHNFTANLSGGSHLSGGISTGDIELEVTGGSRVEMEGAGEELNIDASGGSQLDLEDFPIIDASINMSGGSRATINISGNLDVDLSGGSRVEYIGSPRLGDIELSGDSEVGPK